MVNQFIAGNYRIELSSYPLHFTFISDSLKAGPTEDDQEARFLLKSEKDKMADGSGFPLPPSPRFFLIV